MINITHIKPLLLFVQLYNKCYDLLTDDQIFQNDPFNKQEHVITLRGRELMLFVIGYLVAVILIVMMFEWIMPVIFTGSQ
uniref:Uncharacterized protein n=1 Tax=Rhabditophanes sp. KR3021 TaxID=114890 RepID=A0AC35U5G4_9BILA